MRRLAIIDSDDDEDGYVQPDFKNNASSSSSSSSSSSPSISSSKLRLKDQSSSCTSPLSEVDNNSSEVSHKNIQLGANAEKGFSGYRCGKDPYVEIDVRPYKTQFTSSNKAKDASKRVSSEAMSEVPVVGKKRFEKESKIARSTYDGKSGRQAKLSMFFDTSSTTAKRKREPSEDFVADIDGEVMDDSEMDDDDFIEEDEDEPKRKKGSSGAKKTYGKKGAWEPKFRAGKPIKRIKGIPTLVEAFTVEKAAKERESRGEYPPMSDLSEIFGDIVRRTPGIKELAKTLQKRPLRVATMCSGTESPLLALNLISRAIKDQHGIAIQIHHVFSCEIEPYKQAYIERNFAPPILFRDVCELGSDQAHTAYAALVDVPGNVDLLVAGTSCVDYSNLNTRKKGMEDGGESGRTFFGMLNWVKKHQPAIVLLENVKSAPWEGVGEAFSDINYDAAWSNTFDTKNYYIPHTRQRGYLMATQNRKDSYAGNWEALTRSLARPASSSLEDFLLAADDPRIQKVRLQFALGEGLGKGRSTIDWSKCQQRHERARDEECLGKNRPFTAWEEGGTCHLSHDAWNEWALPQPERVLDLLDITIMRAAKDGIDPHFKSRVWELSQNVDRNIASSRPGICMCLTPSGMPYLTSRGGPMIGLEALSLQGLPIDELLLTRESNDQLQNLAGNAMSSTVVGTCILSALVITQPDLELRRKNHDSEMENLNAQEGERIFTRDGKRGTKMIGRGEDQEYDITTCEKMNISELIKGAIACSQRCTCEGRQGMTLEAVYQCTSCLYTTCAICKGRPEHSYQIDLRPRSDPALFSQVLKRALPMRLWLQAGNKQELNQLTDGVTFTDKKLLARWVDRVSSILNEGVEIRFSELLRQRHWTALYNGYGVRLELLLDAHLPHWKLYIEAAEEEVVGSSLRKLLRQPVARMKINGSSIEEAFLLDGEWEIYIPCSTVISSQMRYYGELVPTWEANMGIEGDFAGTKRYTKFQVEIPSDVSDQLDLDVSGDYTLLENCGTANGSLFSRTRSQDKKDENINIYFFLDPDRFKGKEADRFVFATDIDKLPHPLERVVIIGAPNGWRPKRPKLKQGEASKDELVESVPLSLGGCWRPWISLKTSTPAHFSSHLALAEKASFTLSPCQDAATIVSISSSVSGSARKLWPKVEDEWYQVDLEHHAATTFKTLAWLTERLQLPATLCSWMEITSIESICQNCAPTPPAIQWLHAKNRSPMPVENEQQAGSFEQALKKRPSSFVVQLCLHGTQGQVRIGVNALTLAHRAMARLPKNDCAKGKIALSWQLSMTNLKLDLFNLPKYSLRSNRGDPEAKDPTIFLIPLRKEQKRSLYWMLKQEEDEVAPFLEEEVAEGILAPLGWRIEGKAARNVMIKGGVLADAVGYGKTAISLGLIASKRDYKENIYDMEAGFVPTKATLIIVPPHLCKQWEAEVYKFCGKALKIILIFSKANLNSVSVEDIQKADIVIMSVSVYKSDAYFDSLARLAAANPIPAKAGRYFDSSLHLSLRGLRNRIKELQQEDGVKKVEQSIHDRIDFDESQFTTRKASKRLIGQAYLDAHKGESGLKDIEVTSADALEAMKKTEAKIGSGGDIWGLKTKVVRNDWKKIRAVPLEAFAWQRVIIDEFHYIAEMADRAFSAIKELRAGATWILSGTPPTADFSDVQSIASFLHIHLGVPDDEDSIKTSTRSRKDKSRTQAEQFRNYVDIRSADWHHRRQALGQRFLNQFVRQNVAEIDEIATKILIKPIRMPAAERACYLELAHMIEALDLRHAKRLFRTSQKVASASSTNSKDGTKKRKVGEIDSINDRDERLQKTLGESSSPDEALSRQASHFILSEGEADKLSNAVEACEYIVAERKEQRDDCLDQMERNIVSAIEQHFVVLLQRRFRDEANQALVTFAKNVENGAWGDEDCKPVLLELLNKLKCTPNDLTRDRGKKLFPSWKQKRENKEEDWLEEHKLRDQVHMLQRLRNEYWSRVRSLRYFQAVRDIQKARSNVDRLSIICPSTKCNKTGKILTLDEISIASTCGHSGCNECLLRDAYIGKCCTENCHALAKPASIVLASTLGDERDTTTAYGIKLATVATIIKAIIPKRERILLFVQYDGLLKKVSEALDEYGVNYLRLKGTASTRSTQLSNFQEGTQRVLLLNIADESAAGSNLTVANHVIFLSTLNTEEEQSYHATMEQAKGRAVRFGQTKEVKIWRFFVRDTIDQAVLERREGIKLAEIEDDEQPLNLIDVQKR